MNKELFRERLREIITNSGMTQKEIAQGIGIHSSTLQKYLKGDCLPSLKVIFKLWKLLKFDLDYLLPRR